MKQKEKQYKKMKENTLQLLTLIRQATKNRRNLSLEEQLDGKSPQLKNTQTPQEGIMGR